MPPIDGAGAESRLGKLEERSESPEDLVGKYVGSYEIQRVLGKGGMGTVYLGHHHAIGSRVAVKVLHPRYSADDIVVKRFFAEARAVNIIGHENIVRIFDLNVTIDRRYFYVMEYLEGCTLDELVEKEKGVTIERAVPILLQTLDALAAAHEHGVVHRDLKPSNIFVVRVGQRLGVKILDFGVAKLQHTQTDVTTQTGIVLGTPHFMSPEQAAGADVDPRSDLYSLGVIIYWIATGKLPFAEIRSLPKLLVAQMAEPPPAPRSINPGLSPAWEALILRALAKDPAQRFQSARELGDALQAVVREQPATLPPAKTERERAKEPIELMAVNRVEARRGARVSSAYEIQVRIADAEAFSAMYQSDMVHCGMFIPVPGDLPPVFAEVEVGIFAPGYIGAIPISGRVVSHVNGGANGPFAGRRGVALELLDLDTAKRAQIEVLIQRLPATPRKLPEPQVFNQEAFRLIERYKLLLEKTPYEVLSVPRHADLKTIREAARRVRHETSPDVLGPMAEPQSRQLASVRRRLELAINQLTDPCARADYDAGLANFLGVAQALHAGLRIDELNELRRRFMLNHPNAEREARERLKEAIIADCAGRLGNARTLLETALAADPLNIDIQRRYWTLRHRQVSLGVAGTTPLPADIISNGADPAATPRPQVSAPPPATHAPQASQAPQAQPRASSQPLPPSDLDRQERDRARALRLVRST